MKPINVGLIGIGTVGGGTWTVLKRNAEEITRRAGRPIRITAVADKNVELAKQITGGAARVTDDAFSLVNDPEIDIIVELIGGYGVAKEVVMQAIANGKHVVTANKALLAVHGTEIFTAAQQKGVMVAFEAAVAGGIPIIKALREGLTANRIEWAAGIINGTTNFILSEMRDKGLSFDDVLKEAQRLGYAEADPTFDIEGVDAAHKATLIASIAFGIPVQFDKAYIEGITKLEASDIKYAEQLGYRIKLLGIAKRREQWRRTARASDADSGQAPAGQCRRRDERRHGQGRRRRHDAVLRQGCRCRADCFGGDRRSGRCHPSGDCRCGTPRAASGLPAGCHVQPADLPMSEIETGYYLRLRVEDKPGVLADVTRILADQGISIDAMLQREPEEGEGETDIIILTHVCKESCCRCRDRQDRRSRRAKGQGQADPSGRAAVTLAPESNCHGGCGPRFILSTQSNGVLSFLFTFSSEGAGGGCVCMPTAARRKIKNIKVAAPAKTKPLSISKGGTIPIPAITNSMASSAFS
jgi:homoserine dehydrogenase